MERHHPVVYIGIGLWLGGLGLGLLTLAALAAISVTIIVVSVACGAALLGLGLSYLFRPASILTARDYAAGVIGLGYMALTVYELVHYRGVTSFFMGALLLALAIGYALERSRR